MVLRSTRGYKLVDLLILLGRLSLTLPYRCFRWLFPSSRILPPSLLHSDDVSSSSYSWLLTDNPNRYPISHPWTRFRQNHLVIPIVFVLTIPFSSFSHNSFTGRSDVVNDLLEPKPRFVSSVEWVTELEVLCVLVGIGPSLRSWWSSTNRGSLR